MGGWTSITSSESYSFGLKSEKKSNKTVGTETQVQNGSFDFKHMQNL